MKINFSEYENLCTDDRQKTIVSRDKRSDCRHIAQNIIRQNKLRSGVRQYKIDGNIIKAGNKCDYLVLNDDLKTAYLIELKGNKIHDAIKQLEDTLQMMKDTIILFFSGLLTQESVRTLFATTRPLVGKISTGNLQTVLP